MKVVAFFRKLTRRASYAGVSGVSGYRRYEGEISEDCQFRCVYCDCRGVDLGGKLELDHFRPHALFKHLLNEPTNLVSACRSCNSKKSSDWPSKVEEPTHLEGRGYVDPFTCCRAEYFGVCKDGYVTSYQAPGDYVIGRLGLNRSLLRGLRVREVLVGNISEEIDKAIVEIEQLIRDGGVLEGKRLEEHKVLCQMSKLLIELCDSPDRH